MDGKHAAPTRPLTIGALAARHGLSRSTLLYYDRIGLLRPPDRSAVGYRRYSPADDERLARICRYRRAGLSLAVIRDLLDSPDADLTDALAGRLTELNEQLRTTRQQQHLILAYLHGDRRPGGTPVVTASRFADLLRLAGMSQGQRRRLHVLFEQAAAEEHQAFLAFLGVADAEARRLRTLADPGSGPPHHADSSAPGLDPHHQSVH